MKAASCVSGTPKVLVRKISFYLYTLTRAQNVAMILSVWPIYSIVVQSFQYTSINKIEFLFVA